MHASARYVTYANKAHFLTPRLKTHDCMRIQHVTHEKGVVQLRGRVTRESWITLNWSRGLAEDICHFARLVDHEMRPSHTQQLLLKTLQRSS